MKKFKFVPHWHSNKELEKIAKRIELLECSDVHCGGSHKEGWFHCSGCPRGIARVIRSWKDK